MATPIVIESLNTSTTCRKRKAAEADLPERAEHESAEGTISTSDPNITEEEKLLMRNLESIWNNFYRPELEKVFGPAPSDLARVPPTVPVSLPAVDEPVSPELTPLTHGGGLDEEEDQSYVLTQPYCDCDCKRCQAAGEGVIDQFSDSE